MSTRSFRGVRVIRFGEFELDVRAAELRRGGSKVKLQEQPFRILTMLLEHPGEVVLREEIRRRLWPNGTIVEVGHGINAAVLRLREALGESAENPRFVETLARRGYRFAGTPDVVYQERPEPASPSVPPFVDTGGLDGQTISHFRVMEKLGGGGMGVVYRAEDLKLGRQVALKFLPPELGSDAVALGRFQREARAASSLTHPNICTIYGVEEHHGQPVIVMEMLEGETLEARLAKGPLPAPKVLAMASQMADALDTAHRRGIVHRDLKPANVFLTRTGVKLLDFGLAKITRGIALSGPDGDHPTREGAILGTLHYMSPEQVKGHDADVASDIFSFGLVLYEMLTGRRAFPGENSATVMAAILTWDPPEVRADEAPRGLDGILRRCLAKDPDERWQSASDLKAALDCIASVSPVPMPAPRGRRLAYGIPAAVLAGILLLVAWNKYSGRWEAQPQHTAAPATAPVRFPEDSPIVRPVSSHTPGPAVPAILPPLNSTSVVTRFTVWPPGDGNVTRLALSPDGRSVAFLSGGRIFVRRFDSLEPHLLEGTDGAGTPFWSPDGSSVAFASKGELKRVRLTGDPPVTIGRINTNMRGAWGTDGTILIGAIGDVVYRLSLTDGAAVPVTRLDPALGETRHMLPRFLPGGKRFLYIAGAQGKAGMLYAGSLDSMEKTAIMPVSSSVEFVPSGPQSSTGYLIYARDRTLTAQGFDTAKLKTFGEPFSVAGPITSVNAVGTEIGVGDFSAAGGALAYRSAGSPDLPMPTNGNAAKAMTARKDVGNIIVVQNWLAGVPR